MPGPKKGASRTKGNVKPSSSSQAAQLLAASGHAPTGFMGFSNQPAFVPASETFDEAESVLDGDIRLVLRKLSKRDTVTKIKALQEFSSLCNSKDEESVKAVVPFWPRIYNKVAIDVDHKVRELAQRALSALAGRVGKTIAPHLKSIMGAWMVSMCDTYPTVASSANTAFTSTFPVAKQAEAVRFCKAEITEYLMSNIIKQTPQTLSEAQTTSQEDMESKYQRVVSSSLQAFRKLLFMLPQDSVSDAMSGHLGSLLASPAFWRHGKSDVLTIKSGVLSLLSATCQLCPEASSKVLSKISPFIFSCLDSTDANLVSYTWEATLSLISAHQDCWQHVNWQKALWPKIKRVLESGCSGQAAFVAPCLLPLLSKIPNRNFTQFFDAFRLGFSEDSVLNSPSDTSALVRSFIECIQYSVRCIAESENNSEIRNLILDQVLVVVQASLTDPKPGLSKTELYASLCSVLAAVRNIDSGVEHDFWTDLSSFIRGRLIVEFMAAEKNSKEGHAKNIAEPSIFQRINLLVQGLVYQQTSPASKKERVKFAAEIAQPQLRKTQVNKEKQKLSGSAETFISDMFVTVYKLATVKEVATPLFFSLFKDLSVLHIPQQAAERLNNRTDHIAVSAAVDLGIEPGTSLVGGSEDLVKSFKSQLVITKEARPDKFREFLCDHVVSMLLYVQGQERLMDLQEGQFTDDIILTLFAFVSYVDEEMGAIILSQVLHSLTKPQMTCQFIEHLLEHVKCVPACRQLVQGDELAGKIDQLTLSVSGVENEDSDMEKTGDISSAVWKMLTSVVSSLDESDNHLFSQSCLDAVMSSCVATLKHLKSSDLSQRTGTVSSVIGLVQALFDKHKVSTHAQLGELVLCLLPLLLKSPLKDEEISEEFQSAWLTGFKVILEKKSHVEIEQHTLQSCSAIKEWVQSAVYSHDELLQVGKVIKLLVKTVASPASAADGEEGHEADSESASKDGNAVEEEFDLCALSAAVDGLLIADSVEVDCLKEFYGYLYMNGSLQSLPPPSHSGPSSHVPLQSLIVETFHNFGVLVLYNELMAGQKQDSQPKQECCQWSTMQLSCLAELTHRLVLLETAVKVNPECFREFPESLLPNLWTGLTKCFRTLTQEPLPIVDLVAQRSDVNHPAFTFGLKSVLELVGKAQLEESGKISPSIQASLMSTRLNFLLRCLDSSEVVAELSEQFASPVTGSGICEAFTLVSAIILSHDTISVRNIADCISGFMALAEDYDVLKDEVKLSVFQQIVDIVKQLKEKDVQLLSGSDSSSPSPEHTQLNVSLARALKLLIIPRNEQYWEFTLCTLVEWIQFLSETKVNPKSDYVMKALLMAVCDLTYLAAHTFSTAAIAAEGTPESTLHSITQTAKTEWTEFFSEGVFSPLLPMFVALASSAPSPTDHHWTLALGPLAAAVSVCPSWLVLAHQLPPRLTTSDTSGISDSIKTLLNHLCPLLLSRYRCVEVAAYKLLTSVMEELPKHETSTDEDGKQEEELRSPPEALIQNVEAAGHFLECLKVVQVDDNIVMDRGTEEHAQAMGYLLAWRLLLQLFRCSPNQLRAKYAQYFKANNSVSDLLDRLFRLIPPYPSPAMLEFTAELSVTAEESEAELGTLAILVYRQCLEILPALVRTWWVDQDRKTSNFIDRFTTQYLSSSLMWQQITSAQSTDSDMEGITIRARPAAREVSATYEMAEVTVNMTITLPENYPLGKLEVACDKRVGVSQSQWDRWLLQLNIFLQHQNGSIVEGLRLWKGNIDKKFEGIEDCMICFSVIHGTTFQLPRLTCRTCKKKFHSSCLYKWFNTSQKSSCPLCRDLF